MANKQAFIQETIKLRDFCKVSLNDKDYRSFQYFLGQLVGMGKAAKALGFKQEATTCIVLAQEFQSIAENSLPKG